MQCFAKLNKQDQIRVLDHRNACEVLCILLMSAENYALGNSNKRVFGKFDKYDNVKNKSHLGLKRQLIYELIVCKQSFQNYVDNYIEFVFPQNLSKDEIKKMVYYWRSLVNPNDAKFYDDIILIIEGREIPDRTFDLSQLPIENTNNNIKKIDNMIEYTNNANCYLDEEDEKVTKEFEQNGNYTYVVEFGVEPGSEIKRIEKKRKKYLKNLKKKKLKKEKEAKEAKEKYEREINKQKGNGFFSSWF